MALTLSKRLFCIKVTGTVMLRVRTNLHKDLKNNKNFKGRNDKNFKSNAT